MVMADQAYNAGNEDKAILILSQATAKDPDYYEPFNYLGRIYSHKGNQALALEMYQKALEVFDQEGIDRKTRRLERDFITKNIDTLQKQLEVQPAGVEIGKGRCRLRGC